MRNQNVFARYEIKYLISKEQREDIQRLMTAHMSEDEYGRSTILNVYLDTPDYRLIRRSLESPVYKEKLRLRSYGTAKGDTTVFLELKKKYESVVYKRRISMTEADAEDYLFAGGKLQDSQIGREIDYAFSYYGNLQPRVFLSYEREAFYAKNDASFRMTFDENILWRDWDLSLREGVYGMPILKDDEVLLEIKTAGAIPLWLTAWLSGNHIYKTSFSKYGCAYRATFSKTYAGGICYA